MLSRDIVIILAASFFYLSSPMLVNPLIAGFTGELGASPALMGVLGGLMSLCSLVMRPVAGNLADRLRKRGLAMAGAAVMGVSCVGYALVSEPLALAVLRVANGAGYSLCSVSMSTWMASLLPPERVGSGMGVFGMMNALGMAVGPSLGLAVQGALGYRAAFVVAGLLAGACVAGAALVGDSGIPKAAPAGQMPSGRAHGTSTLVEARAVPAAVVVMLFTVPYTATQSFLVEFAAERNPAVAVGVFFPVYAVALLVLRMLLRRQFDEVALGPFLVASSVSALASLALIHAMASTALLALAGVLMAGGYGVMCSVCQATAVRAAGPERLGLANGTYYMGFDLGMALGPMLGGALLGWLGPEGLYPALMLTVPLALLAWAVLGRGRD